MICRNFALCRLFSISLVDRFSIVGVRYMIGRHRRIFSSFRISLADSFKIAGVRYMIGQYGRWDYYLEDLQRALVTTNCFIRSVGRSTYQLVAILCAVGAWYSIIYEISSFLEKSSNYHFLWSMSFVVKSAS